MRNSRTWLIFSALRDVARYHYTFKLSLLLFNYSPLKASSVYGYLESLSQNETIIPAVDAIFKNTLTSNGGEMSSYLKRSTFQATRWVKISATESQYVAYSEPTMTHGRTADKPFELFGYTMTISTNAEGELTEITAYPLQVFTETWTACKYEVDESKGPVPFPDFECSFKIMPSF